MTAPWNMGYGVLLGKISPIVASAFVVLECMYDVANVVPTRLYPFRIEDVGK
jgi:hypothetical protein